MGWTLPPAPQSGLTCGGKVGSQGIYPLVRIPWGSTEAVQRIQGPELWDAGGRCRQPVMDKGGLSVGFASHALPDAHRDAHHLAEATGQWCVQWHIKPLCCA